MELDDLEELDLQLAGDAKCSLEGAELEGMELDDLEELELAANAKCSLEEAELEGMELDDLEELEFAGDTEIMDVGAVGDLPLDVALCCDSCSDLVFSASSKSLKNKVAHAR